MSSNRTKISTVTNASSTIDLPVDTIGSNVFEWYEVFNTHATIDMWIRTDGTAAAVATDDNEFVGAKSGTIVRKDAITGTVNGIGVSAGSITVVVKGLQRVDLPVGVLPDPEDV